MLRSMFAGVSGLRSHQTVMDVVGNNIANVNTAGFKASTVTFAESISQVLRGASGTSADRAGINPAQIGLGVKVAQIEGVFTQGASQATGRNTDLAIQGDGFFIVDDGAGGRAYTRLGSFTFDELGMLATGAGAFVQGWQADASGAIDTNGPVQNLQVPLGQVIDPIPTGEVSVGGSLSSDTAIGGVATTSIEIFDSLGVAHELMLTFTKTALNDWSVAGTIDGNAATLTPAVVQFDTSGQLTSAPTLALSGYTPPGAAALNFDIELGSSLPLVQFGGESTMEAKNKDGQAIGHLTGFSISDTGVIDGQFSNGESKTLGQIATASFSNPAGLLRATDSTYQVSVNSGEPLVGMPGTGNRGLMSSGTLEMSNVDLSREFTNLIIAQRGFQANSRVITTTDELLSDLVNIKR
ncbi:MAG: flagellar hook protein FlgE [Acidimicrobiales bacterium]|nr:flagellar hook protein FlgE [Acidimicrobiales bacterium]